MIAYVTYSVILRILVFVVMMVELTSRGAGVRPNHIKPGVATYNNILVIDYKKNEYYANYELLIVCNRIFVIETV